MIRASKNALKEGMKRAAKRLAIGPTFHRRGGREEGQEELTMAPIFEVCKIGVFKFDHSALQWKVTRRRRRPSARNRRRRLHPSLKRGGQQDSWVGVKRKKGIKRKLGFTPGGSDPSLGVACRGVMQNTPSRCWSPYRGPHRTEKTEHRHGTADTHTHTPTSLFSFVGFHLGLATTTYVLPTTNTYLT